MHSENQPEFYKSDPSFLGCEPREVIKHPKPRLFVTRTFLPEVNAQIGNRYDAWGPREAPWSESDLVTGAQGADAMLVCLTEKLTSRVIEALPPSISAIATASIGVDHIDLEAAKHRRISIINAPNAGTVSTAELAFLLILGASRNASQGERLVRSAHWAGWHPTHLIGMELAGKRLGIFGMGRIGRQLAKRARAFDMEIHYRNRTRLPTELEQGAIFHDRTEELFHASDILSLNAPSSPETRFILNARTIECLPQRAIVVNSARGDLVDDAALIAALRSGRVAAAGLDVYAGEPSLNPHYSSIENVFLLPHLGTATREARLAMTLKVLDDLDRVLAARQSGAA